MEESDQEFSSSSSSDEVESLLSNEEENLSVMGEILAYQEPLATSDDGDSNMEDAEDANEDGLTSAMLLRRFEITDPVSTWWVRFFVVLFKLAYLKACLPPLIYTS